MTGRREELRAGLDAVRGRIDAACAAAGRDPAEVTVVVVTKFFPRTDVDVLHELGVRDVGENRDQEAAEKLDPRDRPADLTVHFIGQLQSNKAGSVASYADVVHSIDRPKLVPALERGAHRAGRRLAGLVQVNLDEDAAAGRGGAAPPDVPALCETVAGSSLELRGLMAVAPLGVDPRPAFERLHALAERVRRDHPGASWISAGMSGDLEAAIDAGATHLRVGSAILGSRPPHA